MLELFQGLGEHLYYLWRVTAQAMRLNPETFANVERLPLSGLLTLGVAIIGLMVCGLTIWLVGGLIFGLREPLATVMRMVSLGAAPFVFGFPVLIPYAGAFIGRLLSVWSLLIVLAATNFTYGFTFGAQGAWPIGFSLRVRVTG